jgi:uncharacterized protein GlcG (DUF336 family)
MFEPMEQRLLLSAMLDINHPTFAFFDGDGDSVLVLYRGEGAVQVRLDGDAADNADIDRIQLRDTGVDDTLQIIVQSASSSTTLGSIIGDGSMRTISLRDVIIDGDGVRLGGSLRWFSAAKLTNGADVTLGQAGAYPTRIELNAIDSSGDDESVITIPGDAHRIRIHGDVNHALLAIAGDLERLIVGGSIYDSHLLIGATLGATLDLGDARFAAANINFARIGGDVIDSIISAGGDPGDDARFEDGEVIGRHGDLPTASGRIGSLVIDGVVSGMNSPHINPGIYAGELAHVVVGGFDLTAPDARDNDAVVQGSAVVDPLPMPANALTTDDIEDIIGRAITAATDLGALATISVVDREGNLLGVVRMDGAVVDVDIDAGGAGGLEDVDPAKVPSSLIATTKAGTAAFLSTSEGNAFTTRTAGFIIQQHFPPGILQQDGGPLFGVQFSSLPTSDINRLPLGLSADPGGLPLYQGGELVGGIGVEINGVYTVDPSRVGGRATDEELVALAGQSGFAPADRIRASRVYIDLIQLDYANAEPPPPGSITPTDLGDPGITVLFAPVTSLASKFATTDLFAPASPAVTIEGEVPDNALVDFFAGGLAFIGGDDGIAPDLSTGPGLTADEVQTILFQGHELNQRLRAQIRRDDPQISQVTVSVVDVNGNVLGSFRSPDAPVFGYDVSVQKARTSAFFSRPDAGATLAALGADFTAYVDAAADLGVLLDGTVAVADRTGGFLSRPNLPDGIDTAPPGPFSAILPGDKFSVFNTGLQTSLLLTNLGAFLDAFDAEATEAAGLVAFAAGTLSGPGVAPPGLPGSSLANGMQIFAGSVPLYKDGLLVGAVGVSGDGIEQDDFIAFTAATGFQDFPDGVRRGDQVILNNGVRLPYVKFPRSPFAGV